MKCYIVFEVQGYVELKKAKWILLEGITKPLLLFQEKLLI